MTEGPHISIEVVRVKGLVQKEDVAMPPTTSVKVLQKAGALLTDEIGSNSRETRKMEETILPFYNDTFSFPIAFAGDAKGTTSFDFELMDHFGSNPVLEYTVTDVTFSTHKSDHKPVEKIVMMSRVVGDKELPEEVALTLRTKMTIPKRVAEANLILEDHHADVQLSRAAEVTGDFPLVPHDSQYVWWNLLHDSTWKSRFENCLVESWAPQRKVLSDVPVAQSPSATRRGSSLGGTTPMKRPGSGTRGGSSPNKAGAESTSVKTVGDVVSKRWGCRRTHQVLTKLRLSAEIFNNDGIVPPLTSSKEIPLEIAERVSELSDEGNGLIFSERLEAVRKYVWRARTVMRSEMVQEMLQGFSSTSKVRELLDQLYTLFVCGVYPDAQTSLDGDQRYRLTTAQFTVNHAKVLQGCLLRLVVPSLPENIIEIIVGEDHDPQFAADVFSKDWNPNRHASLADLNFDAATAAEILGVTLSGTVASSSTFSGSGTIQARRGSTVGGATPAVAQPPKTPLSPKTPKKKTAFQEFVSVLIEFCGRLVDTFTDEELSLILKAVSPAITEAHRLTQHLSAAGLSGKLAVAKPRRKSSARRGSKHNTPRKPSTASKGSTATPGTTATSNAVSSSGEPAVGGPIHIKNLDELGRRTEPPKFTK